MQPENPTNPSDTNNPNPLYNAAYQPAAQPTASAPAPPSAEPTKMSRAQRRAHKKLSLSTQEALLISELRDGLVIMEDGSLRAVVMCKSINFDLMSPQEREAVEFSYQGFLNSLDFPIQIFIRSQRVDLSGYLNKLDEIHVNQENVLLSLLMEDYIAYVRYLIEAANVMDKQFYIVIPYYPPLISQEGVATGLRKIGGLFKGKEGTLVINEVDFNRYKSELSQRVQIVLSGLNQMGVQAIPLNTQELIELYYTAYNPQVSRVQRLAPAADLQAPIIGKGEGTAPQVLNGETQ